jgi:hypothetical protein
MRMDHSIQKAGILLGSILCWLVFAGFVGLAFDLATLAIALAR